MRILLTRPQADSAALAGPLRARGDQVLIEPLIDIVRTGGALPVAGVQAIIATSANGVRALAAATDDRALPVFAVGNATARAARDAGFTAVESAAGESATLARLVSSRLAPSGGPLLHVHGRDVTGNLAESLEKAGFEVRSAMLYAAEAATALSPAARKRLAAGEIDAVLFFSPRTARTFVNLARDAGIGDACGEAAAICLSPAVAEAASSLPWRDVRVAASPDQAALIKELDHVAGKPGHRRTALRPKAFGRRAVTDGDDKKGAPSTLEKAVARGAGEQKADTTGGTATPGDTAAKATARRRGPAVGVAAVLAVLLVLAAGYIAWPLWGPSLPGWLQSSLAPVMEAGRTTGLDSRIAAMSGRIATLEKDIAAVRSSLSNLDARPRIDPAWLAALQEAARNNADQTRALSSQLDTVRKSLAEAGRGGEVAALEKRLAELEARIAALSARPGSAEAAGALDALRTQSAARMAQLEQDNLALRQMVAAFDQRLAAIEKRPPGPVGATRENALVLAVGQLRAAARGTDPFAATLSAVAALAGDDPALQPPIGTLKPHAAKGAPDLTALRLRFDRIAGKIAHEAFVPKGDGWIDRTLQRLARIVTIRRSDRQAAARDDENGRVARAELRLAAGDLAGAVEALGGLTGTAAETAAPWLAAARDRLAVDRAIEALYAEALRRTGGGAPSATPSATGGTPGG